MMLELVIRVIVKNPDGSEPTEDIEGNLRYVAEHARNEGLITNETEAEVTDFSYEIRRLA